MYNVQSCCCTSEMCGQMLFVSVKLIVVSMVVVVTVVVGCHWKSYCY